MPRNENKEAVPGWVGGFAEKNPAFAYPEPDLTSLPILDNMDNIDKLQRQQDVWWPEFSWETQMGEADTKRCFQKFAPDISRLGYTDEGKVYSIICPQQGFASKILGALNVEVKVTGQRGWANETNRELAADMGVKGKIWFSPSALDNELVKLLRHFFKAIDQPFPLDKEHCINVTTHKVKDPKQPLFPLRRGQSTDFDVPDFAKHLDEAWAVGNLAVEIGPIEKTGHTVVDEFNQTFMDIFNMASGNMLQAGNVLTWNVWFTAPQLVDVNEWHDHAEKWRKSIDADHVMNDGSSKARYFDGKPFEAIKEMEEIELKKVMTFLKDHLHF